MALPSSPFFDINKPDPRYLRYLAKWLWPYTCRCMKPHDWELDNERQMWVCPFCRRPNGFAIEAGRTTYLEQCFDCGNDFVKWDNHKDDPRCNNCGGTNAAHPGQHTENLLTKKLENVND